MKKILFPTDFSKTAENAFFYALKLAKKIDAELLLTHIYELPDFGSTLKNTSQEVHEMMDMETFENFKSSVNQLREKAEEKGLDKVEWSQMMMQGEVTNSITSLAAKENVDLIVMGTKGATGLQGLFLGSNAAGVINHAKCPVLSIPEKVDPSQAIDKIGYLTNYADEEVHGFDEVLDLATTFSASVNVIHYEKDATEIDDDQMNNWKNKLSNKGKNIHSEIITGTHFEEAISQFAHKENITLLAIQPRRRNFFISFFKTKKSKQIIQHISIPLYTLPEK